MFYNGFRRTFNTVVKGSDAVKEERRMILESAEATKVVPPFDCRIMDFVFIHQLAEVLHPEIRTMQGIPRQRIVLEVYKTSLIRGLALSDNICYNLPARAGWSLHHAARRQQARLRELLGAADCIAKLLDSMEKGHK